MGEYINSQQIRFTTSPTSCGVLELSHLPDNTPTQMAFSLANALYNKANARPSAFVIWSDLVNLPQGWSRGETLFSELESMNVGTVTRTSQQINPKTGNIIALFTLVIDHAQFKAWFTEEYTNRIDVT